MCSTSVLFTCIMTMISSFTMFFIFNIFIFKLFFTNITNFCILIWFLLFIFLITSFCLKLIIFIVCFLQKVFIQSLSLYTSCLFSMSLNDAIAEIQKPDGICSLTFAVDDFRGFFYIHQSFPSMVQDLHK